MKLSYKTLLTWVESCPPPEELATFLTARGIEVESLEALGKGLEKVIIAKILDKSPHPNATRLSLCKVQTDSEILSVVCGASNMKEQDHVACALEGAILPNQQKISHGNIRGQLSQGMLCSHEELGLKAKEGHLEEPGILILPKSAPIGMNLAQFLGLDDYLLTLKIPANRMDLWSYQGIARELGKPLKKRLHPGPLQQDSLIKSSEVFPECPQFWGCRIRGVTIGPSPQELVSELEKLGLSSINHVVDITQIMMLEFGQPLHAYDAQKVDPQSLRVRRSYEGEELKVLGGKTLKLDGSELVVSDQKGALSLAGVIGGEASGVYEKSQDLFLECAQFSPTLIRKASQRHKLRTDAAIRFEKGIDPYACKLVFETFIQRVLQACGGTLESIFYWGKDFHQENFASHGLSLRVSKDYFHRHLGIAKTLAIQPILEQLGCQVQLVDQGFEVRPPSYRPDLKIPEDLLEEIARCVGYDHIPTLMPSLLEPPYPFTEAGGLWESPRQSYENILRAKQHLVGLGFLETIHFAFTSKKSLQRCGIEISSELKILNPMSEELEFLVPSLLPGLLDSVCYHENHHFGSECPSFRAFEMRPIFYEKDGKLRENLMASWLVSGKNWDGGLEAETQRFQFFDLKGVVESFLNQFRIKSYRMVQPKNPKNLELPFAKGSEAMFHPGQFAEIWIGRTYLGHFGMLHPVQKKAFGLNSDCALAELNLEWMLNLGSSKIRHPKLKPWSELPGMERDFAVLVQQDLPCAELAQRALAQAKYGVSKVEVFDVYQGAQIPPGFKSVALRIFFNDEIKMIEEASVDACCELITSAWKKELQAELR